MKQPSLIKLVASMRVCIAALLLVILSLVIFSFSIHKMADDFLRQLGIQKTEADSKITNSILGGYLNAYGLKNAKNIAMGNRSAVATDLLNYTKQYVNSAEFKKEYESLKQNNKPVADKKPETPEEMRANMIGQAKEFVTQAEGFVKSASADSKKLFEQNVAYAKKNLKDAEDPGNKNIRAYTQNYAQLVKYFEQSNETRLKEWEAKYPANYMLFVKARLQQFLNETKDIDFNAQLKDRNGKRIFVNPNYEKKGNRWKMAFRAGKEVVEPAREFVQHWLSEIK